MMHLRIIALALSKRPDASTTRNDDQHDLANMPNNTRRMVEDDNAFSEAGFLFQHFGDAAISTFNKRLCEEQESETHTAASDRLQ
jgi:hypothetical protein